MLGQALKSFHSTVTPFLLFAFMIPSVSAQDQFEYAPELQRYVAVRAARIVLRDVQLLDGTGAGAAVGQTLVLENGRITALGNAADVDVPSDAEIIDLPGHTVIPGLVGMHDHLTATADAAGFGPLEQARMYLANGVTTIRTVGSFHPYQERNLKLAIDSRQLIGPRIHFSGPHVTGPEGGFGMARVSSPDEARRFVAYWAEEGATWIKVYAQIRRGELKAVIEEAHRLGLKVTGHLCSVTYGEAAGLGIDNIEHGLVAAPELDPNHTPDTCPAGSVSGTLDLDPPIDDFAPVIRALVDRGVAFTSTLPVLEMFVPGRPPLDDRVLGLMTPDDSESYRRAHERRSQGDESRGSFLTKEMELERRFAAAGGLLVAGSDPVAAGGVHPGFADQRNYALLLEAGFSPEQAIQIMTANGARLLGQMSQIGTIEVGKTADLVVLEGNLTSDPSTIRRPIIVFKDGIGFNAPELLASVSKRGPESAATEITVSPQVLRRYVGEYETANGRVVIVTLEGERLMSQVRRQRQVELVAESQTRFFVRDMASVSFEFALTTDGAVSGVTLYQGGAEAFARKIR